MATPTLYYDSGQEATVTLETDYRDGYGALIDPLTPVVAGVLLPDMTAMDGFPIDMTRVGNEVGTFYAKFWMPTGLTSVGTYLCIVRWVDPLTMYERKQTYQIVIGVPFGNASVVGV
jgi:hypothetical protein